MAARRTLSPFSFYGGKDRMAPLICSLLDYDHTDLYIEPFGGACRVLLNKPRHGQEIYNDFGHGLCSFFEAMGSRELSEEVIEALYGIVPSEGVFRQMAQRKMEHEQGLTEYMQGQFRKVVWGCCKRYQSKELRELHGHIGRREYGEIVDKASGILSEGVITDGDDRRLFGEYARLYGQYWDIVGGAYREAYNEAGAFFDEELEAAESAQGKRLRNRERHKRKFCHERALEAIEGYTGDMPASGDTGGGKDMVDMAVATFLTYYLSRDGMGLDYSPEKGGSLGRYYSSLGGLRDIAQRLEGVTVTQADALLLVREYRRYRNVMMYLDPSYLKPEDVGRDLGKGIYSRSFSYDDHVRLAEAIKDADARIILSNYEVEPYMGLLTEESGWKRLYHETSTSVGGKRGNKRTEVLWYNY